MNKQIIVFLLSIELFLNYRFIVSIFIKLFHRLRFILTEHPLFLSRNLYTTARIEIRVSVKRVQRVELRWKEMSKNASKRKRKHVECKKDREYGSKKEKRDGEIKRNTLAKKRKITKLERKR